MSFLGYLVGNQWQQYSNVATQVYYVEVATGESQYDLPAGWEDHPQDTWNHSASYGHWINERTGRIVLRDPNTPPPPTYLEDRHVSAFLTSIERNSRPSESIIRHATQNILHLLFTREEGYSIVQEDDRGTSIPDHVVLKLEGRDGGSFYFYDFMMVECKTETVGWAAAYDHCLRHCENTHNESGLVYAMVQVGLNVQFYQWDGTNMNQLSDVLHLRHDVQSVMQMMDWLKKHPFPFVNA